MSIRKLLDRLVAANLAYRNKMPVMTDKAYDDLTDELMAMVVATGPSEDVIVREALEFMASVGASTASDSPWEKARHAAPMGSLNKAQTTAEARSWFFSCQFPKEAKVVSDKCDGISISIQYRRGELVRAVTRGDGEVGEDITRNVRKMKGVVRKCDGFSGHVRGEIVLQRSDWRRHFPGMSNPRNAASGIASRTNGEGVEHLMVLHYQILPDEPKWGGIQTKIDEFHRLEHMGFAVPTFALVKGFEAVEEIYKTYLEKNRDLLDYDIDGLVIEFNDLAVMEGLGDLNRRPKGAVALKFPAMRKETTLRGIRWQVGKSGRITPVAEFDTVDLAGASVSNASLHNLGNIQALAGASGKQRLFAGSQIVVSRRNDVIPALEEVLNVPDLSEEIVPPIRCPSCGSTLVVEGEYLLCRGEDCPAQVLGSISRWVKKIGVLGVGDSLIEALIEHAGVEDAADLYTLDPQKLETIPVGSNGARMGRTAHVIVNELNGKKQLALHTFIGSLGIPLCARSVCKTLVDAGFDTLEKMQKATVESLGAVPGIGPTKAIAFVDGMYTKSALIDKLQKNGVVIAAKSAGALTGKSVCMTGFRSPEMEKAIEDAGGSVKSSVGKGLTFLVTKDPSSTSGKAEKARALGVQVVGVTDMWSMLGVA